MTADQLESDLRCHLNRRPFVPFVMEMQDGRSIVIDDADAVSFGGGSVGYIAPDEFFLLRCEQVRAIKPDVQKATP